MSFHLWQRLYLQLDVQSDPVNAVRVYNAREKCDCKFTTFVGRELLSPRAVYTVNHVQ